MTYLTDANIVSELTKPQPDAKVVRWFRDNEQVLVVDSIILGEIRFGILMLPKGKKRQQLDAWFDRVVVKMTCLPWDATTSLRWARLVADLRRKGLSMPIKDSMIAATALTNALTMVTRNRQDFQKAGLRLVNPFDP